MAYNNQYGGYGSYPFPTYTNNFGQAYNPTPYNAPQQSMPMQSQPPQQMMPNQMQQQAQQQANSNGNYFYVNGIEGAKAFLLQPNASAILFDSDSNKFYIKTANAQGQAILKQFEYSEISPKSPQNQTKGSEPSNYATKQELNELKQQISELMARQPKPTKENKQNV